MKKHVASFIVAFLLLALLVFPVQAGLIWCQGDPVVQLNGTNVQVVVSIPDTQQQLVTGPIEVDYDRGVRAWPVADAPARRRWPGEAPLLDKLSVPDAERSNGRCHQGPGI